MRASGLVMIAGIGSAAPWFLGVVVVATGVVTGEPVLVVSTTPTLSNR